jgi:ABC-type Na+ efflux pump permease subunit
MLEGALLAFILGAAALGVFSIGHEYGNRTLASLLAQPLPRTRLLLSKVVVLAPLLVLLSLVAAFVLFRADGIERMFGGLTRSGSHIYLRTRTAPVDAALVPTGSWRLSC